MLHDQQWDPEAIPMPYCLVAGSLTNAILSDDRKIFLCYTEHIFYRQCAKNTGSRV